MSDIIDIIKNKLQDINEILQEDDGGIEFVEFEDDTVSVKLLGACVGCGMRDLTMTTIVKSELVKEDDRIKDVIVVE